MTIEDFIKAYKELIAEAKTPSQKESAGYYEELVEMLEELKWYRAQDLVLREDVSRKMYWLDVEELVQQIAKAEPPCVNSNEIKSRKGGK